MCVGVSVIVDKHIGVVGQQRDVEYKVTDMVEKIFRTRALCSCLER